MLSVNEWIELLEEGHKLKIYVWCRLDVAEELSIKLEHRIHTNALCNYMKSSLDGIKTCMRCRSCADRLAKKRGRFAAYCINGIFEVIKPVFLNGEWAATVYISNLCSDRKETERRIKKACGRYSLSYDYALPLIENSECELSIESAETLADAAADFFSQETVKSVSASCGMNEKYLGHLFKKNMGLNFCEYKNKLRLREAAYLLNNDSLKIIDIAVALGYDNPAYFSKIFRLEYGLSPTEYRKRRK